MAWELPQYTEAEVDEAGKILASKNWWKNPKAEFAWAVYENWRNAHRLPLNAIQMLLRIRSKRIDKNALVVSRLKRRIAITAKLRRLKRLTLSEIQDIGGCRAIVDSVSNVSEVVAQFKNGRHQHDLLDENDYVANPKKSGYRSHHLIYAYQSKKVANRPFNGQKIEIQIRSRIQHIWATAVETVGVFTKEAIKSSIGNPDWLRFFQLMGTVYAMKEHCATIPRVPCEIEVVREELLHLYQELKVDMALSAYRLLLKPDLERRPKKTAYHLMELNFETRRLRVRQYSIGEAKKAFDDYSEAEKRLEPGKLDVVLVRVDKPAQLRKAYPNYHLDLDEFLKTVHEEIAVPMIGAKTTLSP